MRKSIYSKNQEQFQALLRKLRVDKKLTQEDLAKELGSPQSFVSKYEAGERRLDILELRTICQTLGVSLKYFVEKLEESLDEAR